MNRRCPNCDTPGMKVFYEATDIPVHSCIMLDDPRAAIDFPKRDLSLGFCRRCGFISNVLFDPGVQEYASGYEEQQSFSARFRTFQTELIAHLIERYDLRDKDVVEIGCGKGDFLVELCDAGGNRGLGIDPSCDPDRCEALHSDRVRFIPELYSESHCGHPCDFLCCRHTLEHVQPTNDFVRRMRRFVGQRTDTVVFFEVPDVSRILREQAFWDVYYEHCSYFSPGSLARTFRANHFDIIELGKGFDDQYLLIVARPADGPTSACLPKEDDLQQMKQQVETFRMHVPGRIGAWRSRIASLRQAGQRIAVWGSGSKCVSFLSAVGLGEELEAIVDINPYRQGKFLAGSGRRIVPPEHLRTHNVDVILVMNPIYCDEIRQLIDKLAVSPELIPV